ncbi:MAG: fused MFS/spermidine synthase [Sphingomonadales bacterium]
MASAALPTTNAAARWRFTLAILAGSFLLFLVQPMIARMALPRLGGAPAVWNSAMLVYQALLLGGYAYAHFIGRFAPRTQAGVHLAVLTAASLMLPISLVGSEPSVNANPFLWTPWLLVVSIGPLFFAIAAQAPLLQRWFAISGGGDPYPLYAASNLGSFAGLLAYPLLVEPLLPIAGQSWLWTGGYLIVALLVASCALLLPRGVAVAVPVERAAPVPLRTLATWVLFAAVPSGLMLSTTTYLTTDIVAMPLLWVVPLGLYLLSFSIAFADRRGPADFILRVAPLVVLLGGGVAFAQNPHYPWLFAPLGLILLFVIATALHSELFARRPNAAQLTTFYLAMSVGGVLGGLFCAIVAPLVFDWAYEHPILILLAAALLTTRPLFQFAGDLWARGGRWPVIVGLLAIVLSLAVDNMLPGLPKPLPLTAKVVGLILIIELALIGLGNRIAYTMGLAALMLGLGGWTMISSSVHGGERVRSYFGIYGFGYEKGGVRTLVHGTTVHGMQDLRPGRERDPLSYYAPESGVGLAMRDVARRKPAANIGVVGLGSGTLACYTRPGQNWRFYEIDPAMERIARDPAKFSFLQRCNPTVPVEIGDARLTLAREGGAPLDLLVIDAFSSDAVPMHLLTREAFAVYAKRLAPDGVLMVHVSNRFLKLEPVVAATAAWGWHIAARDYQPGDAEKDHAYSHSYWIALTRDPAALDTLIASTGRAKWTAVAARSGFAGWTDDYASILPLIKWTK